MGKEKHSLSSSIIEISSKDDVTKEIIMLVHKIDYANGNGLDFKMEHAEKFKDTLLNKPVVARYYPLKDDLGDHEAVFDSNGNIIGLETIAIGTIKESYIDDFQLDSETTIKALFAKADLWNYKYPEIISCVEKLVNANNADSSVEVEIYKYGENPTQEYRYPIEYNYLGNCLLGSTILPADSDAGVINIAQKEIAMAVKKDLENLDKKGDVNVSETKELFNKGFETRFHNDIEIAALKFSQIRDQIYNSLNPVNPSSGNRQYNFYLRDLYNEYVIAEDWYTEVDLYKIPYSIENDTVVISAKEQWQKGILGFIPEGVDMDKMMEEYQGKMMELQSQLDNAKEELSKMSETKNVEVEELQTKITELEAKITELNSTIVTQEETKVTLEAELNNKVTELQSKVEELTPFKENFEKAEKEKSVAELNAKYSKLISEDTFKTEEVQNAIAELNSQKLNEIVVAEIAKEKTVTEVSSKIDDVTIVASKQGDLIPQNVLQKYGIEA